MGSVWAENGWLSSRGEGETDLSAGTTKRIRIPRNTIQILSFIVWPVDNTENNLSLCLQSFTVNVAYLSEPASRKLYYPNPTAATADHVIFCTIIQCLPTIFHNV
jgi:hypothetical protein